MISIFLVTAIFPQPALDREAHGLQLPYSQPPKSRRLASEIQKGDHVIVLMPSEDTSPFIPYNGRLTEDV